MNIEHRIIHFQIMHAPFICHFVNKVGAHASYKVLLLLLLPALFAHKLLGKVEL